MTSMRKQQKIFGLWSEPKPNFGKIPKAIKILGYHSREFQNGDIIGIAYYNEASEQNAPPVFVNTGSYIAFSGKPTSEDHACHS